MVNDDADLLVSLKMVEQFERDFQNNETSTDQIESAPGVAIHNDPWPCADDTHQRFLSMNEEDLVDIVTSATSKHTGEMTRRGVNGFSPKMKV